jgi:acyl-CoA thioester hydrolase
MSFIPTPWFEYTVRAQPHHTDYAGIVWHGSYITWMETARVEALEQAGLSFADCVALGCDLPVIDLSIRYRQGVRLGQSVVVRTRIRQVQGVRIIWEYELTNPEATQIYITAQVTLVPVDVAKQKILRTLPGVLQQALAKLQEGVA